jgi:membrane protease YdiL (CAAX protease family)
MSTTSLLTRGWNAAFHPTIRLNHDFPLTGSKLGKSYLLGMLWFFVGSFLPLLLCVLYVGAAVLVAQHISVEQGRYMVSPLIDVNEGAMLRESAVIALLVLSFVCGFGLKLHYYSRVLRRTGNSWLEAVGLRLGPMRKRTWLATFWALFWRAALALFVMLVAQILIGQLVTIHEQPTITLAKSLSGQSLFVFFLMSSVLAPLFEEIAFRGFLFQALRATFHRWKEAAATQKALKGAPGRLATYLGATVFATNIRADLAAVFLSGALFSLQHMQFDPVTMLMLFGMGSLLAEMFRRSGTLWPCILMHALNNACATMMIIYGGASS